MAKPRNSLPPYQENVPSYEERKSPTFFHLLTVAEADVLAVAWQKPSRTGRGLSPGGHWRGRTCRVAPPVEAGRGRWLRAPAGLERPKGPFPGGKGGRCAGTGRAPPARRRAKRRSREDEGLRPPAFSRNIAVERRKRHPSKRRGAGTPRMGPSVVGQVASAWRRFCWVVADLSGQPLRASHSLRRVHECRGGSRFKPQICDGPRRHDEKKAEA